MSTMSDFFELVRTLFIVSDVSSSAGSRHASARQDRQLRWRDPTQPASAA